MWCISIISLLSHYFISLAFSATPFPISTSLIYSYLHFSLWFVWLLSVCAYTCMCTLKHMWWSEDNLGCWSSLSVLFESGSFCHSKTHLPGWLPENLWTSPILTSHLTQEHEDYRRVMPHHESAHSCSMYHVTPPTLIFLTKSDISVCRLSTQIRHFKLYGVSFLQQHLREKVDSKYSELLIHLWMPENNKNKPTRSSKRQDSLEWKIQWWGGIQSNIHQFWFLIT